MSTNSGGEKGLLASATAVSTDEGVATNSANMTSWASATKSSLPKAGNNVLEVILEKDAKGSFQVSEIDCAKFLVKIGLDIKPGVQIDGVQICPGGRGVIFITLKDTVDINNFTRYDVIDITTSGIRAIMVKPAGRREVVISVKGLHPNTSDSTVFKYLEKFGKIVSKRVIYSVFHSGPLAGMKNGDRNFKIELKPGSNIGSYP